MWGAGRRWVTGLARRLAQFDWSATSHDAMKTIYESIITAETRKHLGEYYTPDWLAEHMVAISHQRPALCSTRAPHPACGSGTFLFHAVRGYLEAADASGMNNRDALQGVVSPTSSGIRRSPSGYHPCQGDLPVLGYRSSSVAR